MGAADSSPAAPALLCLDNVMRRLLAFFLIAAVSLASAPSKADPVDDAVAALSSGSFDSVHEGVDELVASGSPRAAAIIGALQNGKLYFRPDHTLYIKQDDGTYVGALTGTPVDAGNVKPVRVNNTIRGAMDAALGALRLFSPETAARMTAAEAVFHAADPSALPALTKALEKETDPAVKTRMEQARAAVILASAESAEANRLAAVSVLRVRGDIDARGFLASLSDQPPAVAAAIAGALTAIDRAAQLWSVAQSIYYGLSLGSVLLLAAAGLAITFGVMGVINMAHGEMVMIGAYTTFAVQQFMHAHTPGMYGASLLFAVPLAFMVSGSIGIVIERTLIRWLYGRPLETLLATWGLSLVLQQAVRSIFGANNQDVDTPAWMSGATALGGLTLTWNRMYIILFSAVVLAGLMAALRYTSLGLRMRAVTQNRRLAAAMGIRTPWIDALTFGLGSGIAGMAGVALSQIDNVSPNLGQSYIIDSFMVVVFGGVGNLWGTTLGALTLGIVNKFLEPVAGAVVAKIVVLVLLILFIQRRPRGMFPLKGRAVES